jgi:hypothetical protein
MLNSNALGAFYSDLRDERYATPFAIYHRRFSTNTNPRWPLAQPMRLLGHNGAPFGGLLQGCACARVPGLCVCSPAALVCCLPRERGLQWGVVGHAYVCVCGRVCVRAWRQPDAHLLCHVLVCRRDQHTAGKPQLGGLAPGGPAQ